MWSLVSCGKVLGYIRPASSLLDPYVFVAGPNKHAHLVFSPVSAIASGSLDSKSVELCVVVGPFHSQTRNSRHVGSVEIPGRRGV